MLKIRFEHTNENIRNFTVSYPYEGFWFQILIELYNYNLVLHLFFFSLLLIIFNTVIYIYTLYI